VEETGLLVFERVFRRLCSRCGLGEYAAGELARDGTQHALFLALHHPLSKNGIKSPAHFHNCLALIAYRHALDELKHQSVELVGAEQLAAPASDSPDVNTVIRECLERLPSQQRNILQWYYFEKLNDVQIGQRVFDPASASPKALGQRARKRRLQAQAALAELLWDAGLGPDDWPPPEGP
jgi:DNA-directed RNA polymerase specialized sigma24 family protein